MLSWWLGYWDMLKIKEWFELWDCELCMYVCVDGEGGQALEDDRGKQPETSNK